MSEIPDSTVLAGMPGPISNAVLRSIYQKWAVVRLTLRNLIFRRRTVLMILLAGVPVLAAAALRYWLPIGAARPPAHQFFTGMFIGLYVYFVVVLAAIFYGSSLFADERSDRTITFLLVRPLPREILVIGKFLVYAVGVGVLLLASLAVSYTILSGMEGNAAAFREAVPFLKHARVVVLGVVAYGAVFTFFGAMLKRPVIAAFFYCFMWESILPYLPIFLKKATLMHYMLSLCPHWTSKGEILEFFVSPTPEGRAAWTLVGICVAFLVLTVIALRTKQYTFEKEL